MGIFDTFGLFDDGGQTTTQSTRPWEAQQPYLKEIYGQAQARYNDPLQQFGRGRVAGQSAMTMEAQQAGLQAIRGAGQGNVGGMIQDVAGGRYLSPDSNPWLRGLAEQGAQDISRQFKRAAFPGASMGAMGRVGSGFELNQQRAAYEGLGSALQRNYQNIYGANYGMERGFMQQAPQMQATYDANTRSQLGFGAQMGQGADIHAQRQLDDLIAKFRFTQQEPEQRLDRYTQRLYGGPQYGTTTMYQSPQGMTQSQAAGLGISAMGLFMGCARDLKVEIAVPEPETTLQLLEAMPIALWKYNDVAAEDSGDYATHMGPYADDMQQLFALGNGRIISWIDLGGIALNALKGAAARIADVKQELAAAMERIQKLEEVSA